MLRKRQRRKPNDARHGRRRMTMFDATVVLFLIIIWVVAFFLSDRIDAQERRIRDLENRK